MFVSGLLLKMDKTQRQAVLDNSLLLEMDRAEHRTVFIVEDGQVRI